MTKAAAIYVRISRDPGSDRLGVRRQEKACRELVERLGWDVAHVYEDDDVSAYSGRRRPAYDQMLDDLDGGKVDALVAWAPDRFTRSTRELEDLIDAVEKAGATVSTVQSGLYDLSTPAGRMQARVVGSVARFESEHKSARLRAKHAEIAQAGGIAGGGTRPYGFNDDRITHRKAEAKVIRDAASKVLDGWSLRAICVDLNARSVATVTGRPWTTQVLRTVLTSPRTAGKREHRGNTTPAVWRPILDETTWHRVRAVLLDPERTKRSGRPARRLLSGGIARCGACGAGLVSRPRADKVPCYVCAKGPNFKGCGAIRILGEPLDDLVSSAVIEALADLDLANTHDGEGQIDGGGEMAATIQRLEVELEALADDYADGKLGRDAYAKASARFESRLADARRAIAAEVRARAPKIELPPDIATAWPTMPTEDRRHVIEAVVESVVVGPAVKGRNRFDADRVVINWRA